MSGAASALAWLQFGFHLVLAIAFGVVALVLARRAGKGAYVLAGMAAVDLVGLVFARVVWTSMRSAPLDQLDTIMTVMGLADILLGLLSCGLVLLAAMMLRRAPPA